MPLQAADRPRRVARPRRLCSHGPRPPEAASTIPPPAGAPGALQRRPWPLEPGRRVRPPCSSSMQSTSRAWPRTSLFRFSAVMFGTSERRRYGRHGLAWRHSKARHRFQDRHRPSKSEDRFEPRGTIDKSFLGAPRTPSWVRKAEPSNDMNYPRKPKFTPRQDLRRTR